MLKLNNKGFAIASILYSIMVLFLILLLSILGMLGSRKATLDKNKRDIVSELNDAYTRNKILFEHRNITIINNGNRDDILFALMDGVSAIDINGNTIGSEFIRYEGIDIDNLQNQTYKLTYTANNGGNTIVGSRNVTFVNTSDVKVFDYTGDSQTFTPTKNGSYKVELWGAQGGAGSADGSNYVFPGGNGAYVTGNINILKHSNIYIYVGSKGENHPYDDENPSSISFNGGGAGGYDVALGGSSDSGGSGGGATDIRLTNGYWDNFNSLKSRIMIASGGGGGAWNAYTTSQGQNGGGLFVKGLYVNGHHGTRVLVSDGTQTSGYNFGIGANKGSTSGSSAGGGGGGYYTANVNDLVQGVGGTSFISGYLGCDAISEESTENNIIHTGQPNHYSGYIFKNGVMHSGADEMPTHDGTSTMVGNSGNGYAKISLIYYYE